MKSIANESTVSSTTREYFSHVLTSRRHVITVDANLHVRATQDNSETTTTCGCTFLRLEPYLPTDISSPLL